jgi:hypothetical protein
LRLDVLASRVRRLSPPLNHHPERFHEERSEIAAEIAALARAVAPRRILKSVKVDVTDQRGRVVLGQMVVNGRRIAIVKRKAFRISGQ